MMITNSHCTIDDDDDDDDDVDDDHKRALSSLIDSARPFLRDELHLVDPSLPSLLAVLRSAGAGECYHKFSTFIAHLAGVHRILKLWKFSDVVAKCGLFHSAYSNSYVNLAIFDPSTGRNQVSRLIGAPAERLVHLFCVVPRQKLIHDDLLSCYSDDELVGHVKMSKSSLRAAREHGRFDSSELWRKKLRGVVPAEGLVVRHIRTGEEVRVPRRVVALFLVVTVADFSDQYMDYQDKLFENDNGRLELNGNCWAALWPGTGKPGLWMNSLSRMAALYRLIASEECLRIEESRSKSKSSMLYVFDQCDRDEDVELVIPPMFHHCTKVVGAMEQRMARDLYWEVIRDDNGLQGGEEKMLESIKRNEFVGEPHLVLCHLYMSMGRYEEAEEEAERGLRLVLEWGSSWDKRMSWAGWVAWGRLMLGKAKERSWPHTSWEIVDLGLVR